MEGFQKKYIYSILSTYTKYESVAYQMLSVEAKYGYLLRDQIITKKENESIEETRVPGVKLQ